MTEVIYNTSMTLKKNNYTKYIYSLPRYLLVILIILLIIYLILFSEKKDLNFEYFKLTITILLFLFGIYILYQRSVFLKFYISKISRKKLKELNFIGSKKDYYTVLLLLFTVIFLSLIILDTFWSHMNYNVEIDTSPTMLSLLIFTLIILSQTVKNKYF